VRLFKTAPQLLDQYILLLIGKGVQPAENVFKEDRSFADVIVASDVEKYDDCYQNCAANTAPEDYLCAPETIVT